MAVTNAERPEEATQVPDQTTRTNQLLQRLFRLLAILVPVGLFTASILVSLVFWVSLNPLYGQISAWLAVAGLIVAILAMFFFRSE